MSGHAGPVYVACVANGNQRSQRHFMKGVLVGCGGVANDAAEHGGERNEAHGRMAGGPLRFGCSRVLAFHCSALLYAESKDRLVYVWVLDCARRLMGWDVPGHGAGVRCRHA